MLRSHDELVRLRMDLISSGFLGHEADEIVQGLENELNDQIKQLVLQTVDDAIAIATNMGADEFLDDVTIRQHGYGYMVATKSGKTDYSTEPVDMKPALLSKGKISAKTGDRYRVVPITEKKKIDDIFDVQVKADAEQAKRRRDLAAKNRVSSEMFGEESVETATKNYADARKQFYKMKQDKETRGEARFRTVTDSSPSDSWIIPAKNLDMTQSLTTLNQQLTESIEIHIETMASFYREEFA